MAQFSYANFSNEAREAVMTAADVALSEGSSTVRIEHLAAAIDGASRGSRPEEELGRIPFDLTAVAALNRAHDEAIAAHEVVELRHIRSALP
jgi:hypothetical protein